MSCLKKLDLKLSDFLRDAHQFIINFFIPISESAPHIYISALPFAPADSLTAQHYRSQLSNTLSVISGHNHSWTANINVLQGHIGDVWSVAFSPNGRWIASGSSDKSIQVWDAETGKMVSGPFEGHTGDVLSVAFSPDGR